MNMVSTVSNLLDNANMNEVVINDIKKASLHPFGWVSDPKSIPDVYINRYVLQDRYEEFKQKWSESFIKLFKAKRITRVFNEYGTSFKLKVANI
jgi:hypothetical protein